MTIDSMQAAIGERGCQRVSVPVVVLPPGTRSRSTYRGLNPEQQELLRYSVDGALLDNSAKACDYLLALPWSGPSGAVVLVELKGNHVGEAAQQIESTIKRLGGAAQALPLYARIVASRCTATDETDTRVRNLRRRIGPARLKIRSRVIEERLADIGA